MKRLFLFIFPIIAASCGLFHKKNKGIQVPKTFFTQQSVLPLHKSLALNYLVQGTEYNEDLMVYPLSDSGYQMEVMQNAVKTTVWVDTDAIQNAHKYIEPTGGEDENLDDATSLWLSRAVFNELRTAGKTTLELSNGQKVDFYVSGMSSEQIPLQDSTYTLPLVELKNDSLNYYMAFVPDSMYPLVVTQFLGNRLRLINIQNSLYPTNDFVLAEGAHLHYRMVEAGVNEYKIELTCKSISDSSLRFAMHGTYTSSAYNYTFDYDVLFRADAMANPAFMVPVFSALKGEMVYDKSNWIVINKQQVDSLFQLGRGYLSVPHYAEDPSENPEYYEDDESRAAAQQEFDESHHTYFELLQFGRIREDVWQFNDPYGNNIQLPSQIMNSDDYGIELHVMNRGKFPLLLYYNDGELYEISLEYAGYDE